MNKKWTLLLMAALIATMTIPSMADSNVGSELTEISYIECELLNDEEDDYDLEPIDWDAELEYFKELVSSEDYAELEKLIIEVAPLEEAENYEEADKVWDEIDTILEAYEDEMDFQL